MDNIQKHLKCPKHEQFNVQLLKVKDVHPNDNQSIFYCCDCSDEDESFQQQNFILIHKIIDYASAQILSKWPPLNNSKLLENLVSELKESQNTTDIIDQINGFFDTFLKELVAKIEICRKSFIRISSELSQQSQNTLEKYQEISKILDLKAILIDESTNVTQKESSCKDLILELQKEKEKNTSEILNIYTEYILLKNQISFTNLNQVKQQIFSLVEKIQMQSTNDEIKKCQSQTEICLSNVVNLLPNQSNEAKPQQVSGWKLVLNSQ